MKKLLVAFAVLAAAACSNSPRNGEKITISRETLADKVKGGWAGQCIGVAVGRPFEFRHHEIIDDSIAVVWDENTIVNCFPSFDDDLYMDITFVDVYERLGIDAPQDSLALAFANAGYYLWHGNQAARYNILRGIMPPLSGSSQYNHHSDDIDFQIESDHSGLMAPGLPREAAKYADRVGHIMASGDGFYGGLYFATMYSLAFISDDMDFVTSEALKAIPVGSKYHSAMADIISWHAGDPCDWKATWAKVQEKYGNDVGCPECTLNGTNIDALMNSAYVLIGLLYGEKDFEKTMTIALRCGQDTDCNASSSCGILGVMLGYKNIPEEFRTMLEKAGDMNFDYTDYSFNRSWQVSLGQGLKVLESAGAVITGEEVSFKYQAPVAAPLEQNYIGLEPVSRTYLRTPVADCPAIEFEGSGIAVGCYMQKDGKTISIYEEYPYVAEVEVYLDGEYQKTAVFPASYHDRAIDLYYRHDLPAGRHKVEFKLLNPENGFVPFVDYFVNYR